MDPKYLWYFLLMLVPLVVFHELGHFLMAKLGGIRVTKFCFGFGKKLFGFRFGDTEYCWNILPLGGYVDFMGELIYTNEIPDDVAHFYNRPKWLRFLVLVMGPLFNMILAFALFFAIFGLRPFQEIKYHGEPYTVGYVQPNSPAAAAGLQPGDRITKVNDQEIKAFKDLDLAVLFLPNKEMNLEVIRGTETMNMSYTAGKHHNEGYGVSYIEAFTRVKILQVPEGSPSAKAGLQVNDVITHVNGESVPSYHAENPVLKLFDKYAGTEPVNLTVEREGQPLDLQITPQKSDRWIIGIGIGKAKSNQYMIGSLSVGSPAALAGLQVNDVMTHINGEEIPEWNPRENALTPLIQKHAAQGLTISIQRDGNPMEIKVNPKQVWQFAPLGTETIAYDLSVTQALEKSWESMVENSTLIYKAVYKLVTFAIPISTLSGPLGVAKAAKESAEYGIWSFLFLMAIISLNLGIMNMLPIPVLDGGEIFVLLVEWITRKDFSLETKMRIKFVGFVFLVGLIAIVIVSDFLKF